MKNSFMYGAVGLLALAVLGVSVGSKIFVVGGGPQPGLTVYDFNQVLNTFYAIP